MAGPSWESFAKLSPEEKKHISEAIVETQVKIISTTYDRAASYSQLIMIAGYASFFGVWSLTKPYLTPSQARWSAVFMIISVCFFVLFEVYKMIANAVHLTTHLNIIQDPEGNPDPVTLLKRFAEYDLARMRFNITFLRVWKIISCVAIFTALAGIGILLWSLVRGL